MTPVLAIALLWGCIIVAAACLVGHIMGLQANLADAEREADTFRRNVRAASELRLTGFIRRNADVINWDQIT